MEREIELWIVGYKLEGKYGWSFQGVCDSEEKAKEACVSPSWFIAPAYLNQIITNTSPEEWVRAYYPKEKEAQLCDQKSEK